MSPFDFCNKMWLSQVRGDEEKTHTLVDPFKAIVEEKQIPDMVGKRCLDSFEEWVLLVDVQSFELFFLNLNSMMKIYPPHLEEPLDSLGMCIFSSPPIAPDCTIIFCGQQDNFLLICQPCDKKWTRLPIELNVNLIRTMLPYNNELFVVSIMEMVIIDLSSLFVGHVEMTRIDISSWWPIACGLYNHMVELCGDLFLVRTMTAAPGLPVIYFDIHRYDPTQEEKLVRVESIKDRAIFLGPGRGVSCCAKNVGVRDDCIYFVMPAYDGERFYEFCLHDQTMSFKLLPKMLTQENHYSFHWVLRTNPRCIISSDEISITEVCQKGSLKEVIGHSEDGIIGHWADLPLELVHSISKYLPLKECGSLPAVCSAWKDLSNPVQEAQVWLLYCPKQNGNCFFFDPFEGKIHELHVEQFSSDDAIRFLFSKDGWVIVGDGVYFFYMLNPFTRDIYCMPIVSCEYPFRGIAFSSVPDSPSCVVFAISGVPRGDFCHIYTWRHGQEDWSVIRFDNDPPFYVEYNNPVFFHGEFYCLGKTGTLGVFSPENNTWRVLDRPAQIYSEQPHPGAQYCYLVESRGELISVFRGNKSDFVRVFKLDQSKMAWTEIVDLGGLTLFLDNRSSIARTLSCKDYKNKIYLPSLHDKADATGAFYYCMESKKHNSDFKSFKEPYNCVWFEPNLNSYE